MLDTWNSWILKIYMSAYCPYEAALLLVGCLKDLGFKLLRHPKYFSEVLSGTSQEVWGSSSPNDIQCHMMGADDLKPAQLRGG